MKAGMLGGNRMGTAMRTFCLAAAWLAGMVAGALKMPLWRYLLFSWIGKTIKMILFAVGGKEILNLFGG